MRPTCALQDCRTWRQIKYDRTRQGRHRWQMVANPAIFECHITRTRSRKNGCEFTSRLPVDCSTWKNAQIWTWMKESWRIQRYAKDPLPSQQTCSLRCALNSHPLRSHHEDSPMSQHQLQVQCLNLKPCFWPLLHDEQSTSVQRQRSHSYIRKMNENEPAKRVGHSGVRLRLFRTTGTFKQKLVVLDKAFSSQKQKGFSNPAKPTLMKHWNALDPLDSGI